MLQNMTQPDRKVSSISTLFLLKQVPILLFVTFNTLFANFSHFKPPKTKKDWFFWNFEKSCCWHLQAGLPTWIPDNLQFELWTPSSLALWCFWITGIFYSRDLKSRLVWTSNGEREVGLQMIWILNGIWNPEAQPSGKCCFWMVGTIAIYLAKAGLFEIWPSKSRDLKCFRI